MESAQPEFAAPVRRKFIPIVVRSMAVINVLVFVAWNGNREWLPFMFRNFLVSWVHLADGRFWVLLTSVFSHNQFLHLLVNSVVLISFGTAMEQLMGHFRFLRFYLIAGIMGSLGHVIGSYYIIGSADQFALGASGALAGVLIVFSLMFPKQKILFFAVIPVPALVGALAFVAIDIWGLIAQAGGGGLPIGHGAHLGGALFGLVYYLVWGRKIRRQFKVFNA